VKEGQTVTQNIQTATTKPSGADRLARMARPPRVKASDPWPPPALTLPDMKTLLRMSNLDSEEQDA
jgi:hypothetical protein